MENWVNWGLGIGLKNFDVSREDLEGVSSRGNTVTEANCDVIEWIVNIYASKNHILDTQNNKIRHISKCFMYVHCVYNPSFTWDSSLASLIQAFECPALISLASLSLFRRCPTLTYCAHVCKFISSPKLADWLYSLILTPLYQEPQLYNLCYPRQYIEQPRIYYLDWFPLLGHTPPPQFPVLSLYYSALLGGTHKYGWITNRQNRPRPSGLDSWRRSGFYLACIWWAKSWKWSECKTRGHHDALLHFSTLRRRLASELTRYNSHRTRIFVAVEDITSMSNLSLVGFIWLFALYFRVNNLDSRSCRAPLCSTLIRLEARQQKGANAASLRN